MTMKEMGSYPETKLVSKRITREKNTIEVMIRMYCGRHHETDSYLCDECRQLLDYAEERLQRCPFKGDKPTCANCTIHCYKHNMREKIRKIMRYSGPRMVYRQPVLAFYHLIDRWRRLKGGTERWQENSNQPKP